MGGGAETAAQATHSIPPLIAGAGLEGLVDVEVEVASDDVGVCHGRRSSSCSCPGTGHWAPARGRPVVDDTHRRAASAHLAVERLDRQVAAALAAEHPRVEHAAATVDEHEIPGRDRVDVEVTARADAWHDRRSVSSGPDERLGELRSHQPIRVVSPAPSAPARMVSVENPGSNPTVRAI